jgi:hypothetical protein
VDSFKIFFFAALEYELQRVTLAKQALYYLSHSISLLLVLEFFEVDSQKLFALDDFGWGCS